MSYIAWVCPGGLFASWMPVSARPIACRAEPRQEAYERLGRARARVEALGEAASPRITLVQGLRLTDRPFTWQAPRPKF